MNNLFSNQEILSAIKSLVLGFVVGSVFALFKFKPPSPETLSGILGIVGIFLGWWIITQILN